MKNYFIIIIFYNTILFGALNYNSEKGFNFKIEGFYSIYYEYFYDIRDNLFHISNFPEYIKLERGGKYSDPEIGITNELYTSRYMSIEPLSDREPNHYIEFNISSSFQSNYIIYAKFYLNSNDDLDRFYNLPPLRLKNFYFNINKEKLYLKLFYREKIEGFDDPLEIFKPGHQETFLRNNPDPIRVFEYNGDECQGIDFKFNYKFIENRTIIIDGLAKWYYSGWPTFSSYFNDTWAFGNRIKFKLTDNIIFANSVLMNSWYSSSSYEYEDHWYIYAFYIEYIVNKLTSLKIEYANSDANYDAYSTRPLNKGEAYKIEILLKDFNSDSKISLSYRNIGERFPTALALYVPNNIGYNFKTEITPFKFFYIMFFYDFQHKQDKKSENKQEIRNETKIEFLKNLLIMRFLYQNILLNNERFIWWLQHTYESYIEYRPGIEFYLKNDLKFELFYDKIFYEQPHREDYKPEKQQSLWIQSTYSVTKKINFILGYKYIRNKIVWNLDEHLYKLKEYEVLRKLRPKPDDVFDNDYGDSYGYYISSEDDIYYEGDTLSHNIFWFNFKWQIFEKSFLNFVLNVANYNGDYGYWDKKIGLSLETYF